MAVVQVDVPQEDYRMALRQTRHTRNRWWSGAQCLLPVQFALFLIYFSSFAAGAEQSTYPRLQGSFLQPAANSARRGSKSLAVEGASWKLDLESHEATVVECKQ